MKNYQTPEMEYILCMSEDILTASGMEVVDKSNEDGGDNHEMNWDW